MTASESTVNSVEPRIDTPAAGVGLSDPSMAQGRRQMLDLVNRLHNTGVQVDIDLPQIAVIGNQSAGKSSLIESISGISLPRAAGTCTRCPTECRLARSSSPWKCIVELRYITDKNGQPLGQARNERFGEPVSDKSEVEDRIRRAQRAILNPSKSAQSFLLDGDTEDDGHELSFSTNYISLQISGPEMADLSFVDLPGLIASVSRGGNERDIAMVESLVTSYISKPSCVILLTVACETDFENQGAHHLAKKYDPEGKRTVGVLTKPDRIPHGEEESWLPLIRNEVEALENHWFCVKQPSSQEMKQGITWGEARSRENDFFALTAPWSELSALHQKYLRTTNLIEKLSTILSDLISKRLPEIQIELDKSIQKAQAAIEKLPKIPSSDAVGEVAGMLASFVEELNRIVEGVPQVDGLIQNIRPAQEAFRRAILCTAPNFSPFDRRAGLTTPYHDREDGLGADDAHGRTIYVDEVARRAEDARARELPGNAPFSVQMSFIGEFTTQWEGPAQTLCISNLVAKHFLGYGQGGLEQRMRILIQEQLQQRTDAAQALIAKLVALEEPGPMTLNTHYLSDYKEKYLSRYRAAREKTTHGTFASSVQNHKPKLPHSADIDSILAHLNNLGLKGIKAADLTKLLPPDEMDPALHIMADVRAYFQVAYKRVADIIPLAIDHELVRGIARGLLPVLYSGLGVGGADGVRICRELAQEDSDVAATREELFKKMERLQIARQQLVRIEV
ncbi:P-loop containing nucleoside triphosphate hydrolase protein [Mycena amicta]|nr:P-loop containing nucleoside triphosphate hydrolase protein [Mycena amicta]